MAIQMQAYEVGEHVTLVFTKVLDEVQRRFWQGSQSRVASSSFSQRIEPQWESSVRWRTLVF